jgi:hypothetical protein
MKKRTANRDRKPAGIAASRSEAPSTNWVPLAAVALAGIICFIVVKVLSHVQLMEAM